MYERILIPTDGSDRAREAAEHAASLATQYGATVHVLYVVDTGEVGLEANPEVVRETTDRIRENGEEATAAIAAMIEAEDLPVVTSVDSGSPPETIVEYADENDVDLIVMGSRGRADVDEGIMGSVTDRVMRMTDIPVVTV